MLAGISRYWRCVFNLRRPLIAREDAGGRFMLRSEYQLCRVGLRLINVDVANQTMEAWNTQRCVASCRISVSLNRFVISLVEENDFQEVC